uniref:Uncharacterized protein n=1 Tax=Anguilla anguilla TaxID=7936 RepID=A0A0E9X900_ANGAN
MQIVSVSVSEVPVAGALRQGRDNPNLPVWCSQLTLHHTGGMTAQRISALRNIWVCAHCMRVPTHVNLTNKYDL